MSAIFTELARTYTARAFLASLGSTTSQVVNNLFMFIGHILPWTSADGPGNPSDTFPPYPVDTVAGHINVWANMVHLKRISTSSLVIQRFNWTSGIVYQEYDQDIDFLDPTLGLRPYYVMTDDFNVYKCLFNFNGNPSFVKPTGTSTNVIQTGDGYQWKYMFTVSTSDQQNFLTDEWIPVHTLLVSDNSTQWDVQQNAINGALNIIQVLTQGVGYITPPSVTITGDGSGATATSVIKNGSVTQIKIQNPGQGYTFATATVSGGQITAITITDPGTGYVSAPSVSIVGDGSAATAHTVIVNGSVTQVIIDDPGSNYTTATVTIAAGSGTQAVAIATVSGGVTLKPIIGPPGGHGSDPVSELGAIFAVVQSPFQFDQSGEFTISNDFRTVGILSNPVLYNTNPATLATGTVYSQAWNLPLISVTNTFLPDDLIQGMTSGATGAVLDYGATPGPGPGVLRVVNVIGSFIPGEIIETLDTTKSGQLQLATGTAQSGGTLQITLSLSDTGTAQQYAGATILLSSGQGSGQIRIIASYNASTKVATITENWVTTPNSSTHYSIANIKYPDLQPNTGSIVYYENRRPITRASQQTELIMPSLEF